MRKTRSHVSPSVSSMIAISVATSAICTLFILAGLSFRGQLSANLTSPFTTNQGTTTTGNAVQSGQSGSAGSTESHTESPDQSGETGECILQINKCSPTDAGCMEAAIFLKVDCEDSRCNEVHNSCKAIKIEKIEDHEDDEDDKNEESKKGKGTVETTVNSHTNTLEKRDTRSDSDDDSHSDSDNEERRDTSESDRSDKQQLGCYTTKGEWTTDRGACAAPVRKMSTGTQQPFITDDTSGSTGTTTSNSPQTSGLSGHREIEADQQDNDLQKGFQELFNTSTGPSAATTNLLAAATNALERLQILAGSPLPDNTRTMVNDTRSWIATLITDISSGQPNDDDVQAKADELKSKLTDTMQLVSATIPTGAVRPEGVLKTMDRIFATLPVVFAFLQEQGAPISLDTSTTYLATSNAYTKTRADCLGTASKCIGLRDIITGLESLRLSMSVTLEQLGKTDLQARIDEMMR